MKLLLTVLVALFLFFHPIETILVFLILFVLLCVVCACAVSKDDDRGSMPK